MAKEKTDPLELAIAKLEKSYGKGTVITFDGTFVPPRVDVIPTGSLALDLALGIGGVPRGRIIELFGPEMSGKSTLASHIVAEAQKMGGKCAYVDVEHAYDCAYAAKLGVKINEILFSQPDTGEQALSVAEQLVRSGRIAVLVVDSVAALVPQAEIEGEMGDSHVGLQARLMSQAMRKLNGVVMQTNTLMVFINQLREKIGIQFGSPETTTGGRALKFYSSVRLDIRRVGMIKSGNDVIGQKTRVKVVKNKLAPPFKEAEFDIIYGEGISGTGEVVDLGVDLGLIEKGGVWYAYKDAKVQGRDAMKQWLKDNPVQYEELKQQVREQIGL
jgi:recombination protein RecA